MAPSVDVVDGVGTGTVVVGVASSVVVTLMLATDCGGLPGTA